MSIPTPAKLPLLTEPPEAKRYPDVFTICQAELVSVTPIFMAGARNVLKNRKQKIFEDDYEAELRTASFIGGLRYWFRAYLGAAQANDLSKLRQIETYVFGSTQVAAPYSLELTIRNSTKKEKRRILVHSDKYLKVCALYPATFTLRFTARPGQADVSEDIKSALWLLVHLGGVGKRTRRGFGGLEYKDKRPRTAGMLVERLKSSLNIIRQTARSLPPNFRPQYPILHPDHCKIAVCTEAFPTYEEAMQAFWGPLRRKPYLKDPVFGFTDPKQKMGRTKRRASAVHLHIARSKAGFHPVMTAFRTDTGDNWRKAEDLLKEVIKASRGEFIFGEAATW